MSAASTRLSPGNAQLPAWAAICQAEVLGRVGHRRTQEAGFTHPAGHAPAWVTPSGCDLALLHRTHVALVVQAARGDVPEALVGPVRHVRLNRHHRSRTSRLRGVA